MTRTTHLLLSALFGLVVGFASARGLLLSSWTALVPWFVGGAIAGGVANVRGVAIWSGAAYGVALSISFLVTGFSGVLEQLPSFLILTALLSIVGAAGGVASAWLGYAVRTFFLHI